MKEQVGTFNQEKTLVGSFSVIVNTDGLFAALMWMLVLATTCVGWASQEQPGG